MSVTAKLHHPLLRCGVAATAAVAGMMLVQAAHATTVPPDPCRGTRGEVCHSEENCIALPGTDFSVCKETYLYWNE